MKQEKYIVCQFCGKKFNRAEFIDLLCKNNCCKDCFSKGVRMFPDKIGKEIIIALRGVK
jgi:hypothetical protein